GGSAAGIPERNTLRQGRISENVAGRDARLTGEHVPERPLRKTALGSDGRCRTRAADRLRQPGKPAHGPGRCAPEGSSDPPRARFEPGTSDPPVADRESSSVADRRDRRNRTCCPDGEGTTCFPPDESLGILDFEHP